MTTNKDDNPEGRVVRPVRSDNTVGADGGTPQRPYRDGEQLDPQNARGHGDKRTQAQERGNDPDRG